MNANEMRLRETRPTLDETYLDMANVVARRSTCLRRAVGCVLVDKRGRVLSTGYNGVARGAAHCNAYVQLKSGARVHPYACSGAGAPSGTNLDACDAIHAEQNALLQCRDVDKIYSCYTTVSPCISCTKLLLATGCHELVFRERYASAVMTEASRLWVSTGRVERYLKLP